MNDPDQTVAFPLPKGSDPGADPWPARDSGPVADPWPARDGGPGADPWPDDGLRDVEPGGDEEDLADRSVTLTSLGFVRAALKRSARLWCALAILGMIIGFAFYAAFPPAQQATTSILITTDPSQDPADAIATDVALAQSQTVAAEAIKQLGLTDSIDVFLAEYTVADPTDELLVFTANASTSAEAVRRVSVISSVFLQFRESYLKDQLQTEQTALNEQVTQAEQLVNSINQQITAESAQVATPAQQTRLSDLRTELTNAQTALASVQGNQVSTSATDSATTATEINGTVSVGAPTPVPHTFKKGAAFFVFVGFFAGLVLGMAIVIIRALTSDRLRRRGEIAEFIGAPVKLSVRSMGPPSRLPRLRRSADGEALDMRRMVAHLNGLARPLSGVAPSASRRLKGLAIVAVDNTAQVAPVIVELASWNAKQGKKVVVADLAEGRLAAGLLGVGSPGIHPISKAGVDIMVVVPERDDIALAGPIPGFRDQSPGIDPELAAACASADLLFTLATVDPASGGDYLSTWATDAAAVVTAGESSSTRIRAVGDMIRLAGLRLSSVVLTGADKDDESLGLVYARDEDAASPLAI